MSNDVRHDDHLQIPPQYRQFLDIEADVGDDEEDEETEVDAQEQFINDEDIEDTDGTVSERSISPEYSGSGAIEEQLDEYWLQFIGRAHENSAATRPRRVDDIGESQMLYTPHKDDDPLWRVQCQIGSEEYVAAFLLRHAKEKHQLRSAFTPGTVRGYVYLECQMNQDLIRLLKSTKSIINTRKEGVRRTMISLEDGLKLLTLKPAIVQAQVGSFVRIRKGLYEGDVACVRRRFHWGVEVLLIPRLDYGNTKSTSTKRKASPLKPHPELFNPSRAPTGTLKLQSDGSYRLGQLLLENGLVIKSLDFNSISSSLTEIPWFYFAHFLDSKHPDILKNLETLPRPSEWIFEAGNVVAECRRKEGGELAVISAGVVVDVWPDCAEVDMGQEGTRRVIWDRLLKQFEIGQAVTVTGGSHSGFAGWLTNVTYDKATVTEKTEAGDIRQRRPGTGAMKEITVHINCLVPLKDDVGIKGLAVQPILEKRTRPHAWLGIYVLVSKPQHPLKGKEGQVVNVLFGQQTDSGMRVEIRLVHYDPNVPYLKVTMDYDDVAVASTGQKLHEFRDPEGFVNLELNFDNTAVQSASLAGNMTPLPSPCSIYDGPAWDPSSRTPGRLPSPTWNPSALSTPEREDLLHDSSPDGPSIFTQGAQHVLLNTALIDYKLLATLNGGGHQDKEQTVTICLSAGRLCMRYMKYNNSQPLQPEWVTPKYPSPTHDNGLLVVIRGEHCGKYVRRVDHRPTPTGINVLVAVVTRSSGAPDLLTGEQLELSPSDLCKAYESTADKKINKGVTADLRRLYSRHVK